MRRAFVGALIALAACAAPAGAQDAYPSKPITMIVPFAAGGSTDVIGRVIAEGLRQVLGQPVLVDNRGGAGGSIGTLAIARAQPDGYTIGMGTASTLAINPAAYKSLPFDVLTDLTPIGNIAAVPNIMTIHPGVAATDMASFIALARAQPRKLSYASAGVGSVSHLLGEQFKLATGTDLLHVPYRGVGPALNDAVGGQVQVMYDNLPTSLQLAQDGRLRPLGVSGAKRAEALAERADLRRAQARRHELDGVLRPDCAEGDAGADREAAQRRAAQGAGDARRAGQAYRPAGHRGRQFAGGVPRRDRARAGAHAPRRGGGEDRAELKRAQPLSIRECRLRCYLICKFSFCTIAA